MNPPSRPKVSSSLLHYYCHNCRTEVRITECYKCIVCSSGFVEEMATWNNESTTARRGTSDRSNNNNNENNDDHSDSFESLNSINAAPNETEEANTNTNTTNTPRQENSIGNALMNGVLDVVDLFHGARNNPAAQAAASTSRQALNTEQLRDRIHNLLFALGEERRRSSGNPENYVEPETNDNINQASDLEGMLMRTLRLLFFTTSRPLTNQKLDRIPKVNINAEDLINHPRCSICWEEFQIDESVRKLPCSHLHHENCIFPWLVMHRTCPLCRYRLNDELDFGDFSQQEQQPATIETSSFESASDSSIETIGGGADISGDVDNPTDNI